MEVEVGGVGGRRGCRVYRASWEEDGVIITIKKKKKKGREKVGGGGGESRTKKPWTASQNVHSEVYNRQHSALSLSVSVCLSIFMKPSLSLSRSPLFGRGLDVKKKAYMLIFYPRK